MNTLKAKENVDQFVVVAVVVVPEGYRVIINNN